MGGVAGAAARALLPVALLLAVVTGATAWHWVNKSIWGAAAGSGWPTGGLLGGPLLPAGRLPDAVPPLVLGYTHCVSAPAKEGTCTLCSSRTYRHKAVRTDVPGGVWGWLRGLPPWTRTPPLSAPIG